MIVSIFRAGIEMDYPGSLLVMNPVPEGSSLDPAEIDDLIEGIIDNGVPEGKNATPYILGELSNRTDMRSIEANRDLLISNASLAADIALEMAQRS